MAANGNGKVNGNGSIRRRRRPADAPTTTQLDDGRLATDAEPEFDEVAVPAEIAPAGLSGGASTLGAPVAPPGSGSGLRRALREAGNWRELRRTPYGLTPVLIIGLMTFFQTFDTRTFYLAQFEITRDLNIEYGNIIGIIATVGTISIIAALFIGYWADRHPRVPLVAIGCIFSGLAAMLTARARSSFTFGAPRVFDDVSDTASQVPRFALLADYYPPTVRGKVFAIVGGSSRVATVLAPLVAGGLIVWLGWRWTFVIIGLGIAVTGVLTLVFLREPVRGYMERVEAGAGDEVARTEDEPQSFGEAWRSVMAVRTLRRTLLADVFTNIYDGVFTILFPVFLAEHYGLSALERGFILAPGALLSVFGAYVGGGLVDTFIRRNPGRVLTARGLLEVISTLGLLAAAFQPPLVILVLFYGINAFGLSLSGPAANSVYSQVIPPAVRTQGLQIFGLAALPTTIIALPVFATIRYEYGYDAVFFGLVPFALVGAAVAASAGGFFALDRRAALAASVAADEWRRAKEGGSTKLLVCRNVEVEYDGVQVLFDVDFDLEEGEILALLGTNGAGKSTLLRAISGTQEASNGAIVFDGRDITHMPPDEIAHRGVISMPGGRGVFPGLTVRENLVLGNWMTDDAEIVRTRVAEVFEMFPVLARRADVLAGDLSGGEQQMVSLAQAFLAGPRLLLIDELSLGLSPAVVGELLEIVRAIHARGTTIVVVEQSVNVALTLAQRAVFMEKGEVRFFGETAELLRRPDILRAVYVKGTGALTDGPASAVRSERDRRALELGTAAPVLEVRDIVKRFGGVTALDEVGFDLRDGEVLGIIGPNGSGKTTLFDVISGYQAPDSGTISYEGVDVTTLGPEERAKRKLVRRFQDARLFPSLTVYETLLVALEQQVEVRNTLLSAVGMPHARRAERRLRARGDRLVELLELGAYRDKFVKELSTGLRRVVDLACVLGAEPRVLLLDEPSTGIAQAEAEGLGPLLRRVRFETGCSILVIEHDMPLISSISDELVAMAQGRVLRRGLPDDVLNDEAVIESYLGTSQEAVRRSGSLV